MQAKTDSADLTPEQQLLFEMQGCSTQNKFALSTPPGKSVRREGKTELGEFGRIGDNARLVSDVSRLAIFKGFSLHAGTSVPPQRTGESEGAQPVALGDGALERLLRYMARNSTPLERMKPASGGDVLIKLKHPWSDGTTRLRFSGAELVERLAVLVPHPRSNLTRFGGCFANEMAAEVDNSAPPSQATDTPSGVRKVYTLSWSKLLALVFKEDITRCKKCGRSVKITDAILDRGAITRILTSPHLPTEIPKFHPPLRPQGLRYL